uniref:MYND-type domain-containing protein n=1 Tax=Mycena chlorophos TaxID=658473 RepID=A0ABQ0LT61_MYCCL|nr:predicted protein [Mycena chlorophos]
MSSIPRPAKDFVLDALRGNDAEMERLAREILLKRFPRTHFSKLFCVFHAILDPAPIRGLLDSDLALPAARNAVIQQLRRFESMIRAVDGIVSYDVWLGGGARMPSAALAEFFPRLLSWMEAYDVLAEITYASNAYERAESHYHQLQVVRALCPYDDATVRPIIFQNSRIYWILGRAWALLPSVGSRYDIDDFKLRIHAVCWIWDQDYEDFRGGHRYKILELLSGAGGDWDVLARLCILNARLFFPTSDSFIDESVVTIMRTAMWAILAATPAARLFHQTLRTEGMIPYLVNAFLSLLAVRRVGRNHMSTNGCFRIIGLCFTEPFDGAAFVQAVQAGFIYAVNWYGSLFGDHDSLSVQVVNMINQGISPFFSHYTILDALRGTPLEADLRGSFSFRSIALAQTWTEFRSFALTRLSIATRLDAGEFKAAQRGCDNPKCLVILPRTEFKCCGGCRQLLYCSIECQKASWKSSHKRYCAQRFQNAQHIPLSRKDRTFLRTLLHTGWLSERKHLTENLLRYCLRPQRSDNPADALTILDDTIEDRITRLDTIPFADEGAREIIAAAENAEDLVRAKQSGGRLLLQYVQVHRVDGHGAPDGKDFIRLPFPLYCETADRIEEVGKIVAELTPRDDWAGMDLDAQMQRLQPFIENCCETH